MRRLAPLAALTVLALPALWPYTHPDIARTNDSLPHYFRLVELDHLIRQGVLYPRWAPDMVHGYGYPVFNFFPSLFHYFAELLHLGGLSFLAAFETASAAALVLSAWGAFWLAREWFDETAGVIAGVAYLYSPYLLYDAHVRGAPPENLALAILPLVLLGVWRVSRGSTVAIVWTALAFATFLLSHHGVALQASPFVLAIGLLGAATRHGFPRTNTHEKKGSGSIRVHPRPIAHAVLRVVIALALGMALSAFFWLPALTESQFAQVGRGTGNAGMSYQLNFLSPSDMLALPRLPIDPALLNPPVVRPLPHVGLALAILALPAWARADRSRRGLISCLALGLAAAIALISPLARPVWDSISLLRMTLFPWRLLGPTSLLISLLAGLAVSELLARAGSLRFGRWPASGVPILALSGLMLGGLPWAYPPSEPITASPTLADLARFEIPPYFIGTTTVGEYLPRWVQRLPDTREMQAEIVSGRDPDRADRSSLPAGASVQAIARQPLGVTYSVDSPQDFRFVYHTFYFPGWRVALDGESVPIHVTSPEGLISVDVPHGKHSLRIYWGTTTPRLQGGLISLLALLTGAGILWVARGPHPPPDRGLWIADCGSKTPPRERSNPKSAIVNPQSGWPAASFANHWSRRSGVRPRSLILFGLAFLAFKLAVVDRGLTPLLRSSLEGDTLAGVEHPLQQDYQGELLLLGWDASKERLRADETVELHLYWKAMRPLGVPYGVKVELHDGQGRRWSETDTPRPRDWRFTPGTDLWPAGAYVLDPYLLSPLEGTPPGDYTIDVTVFSLLDLRALGTATIGHLSVTHPSRTESGQALADFGPILLREASIDRAEAAPGDPLGVQLVWQSNRGVDRDATASLEILDSSGRSRFSEFFALAEGYPTSQWQPGDVLRDQLSFTLPARLESDDYSVYVEASVHGTATNAGPYRIGDLHLHAPERAFTPPRVSTRMSASLSPAVELYGTRFNPDARAGEPFPIALVWLSRQEFLQSYRVFVHVQGEAGDIVAQSDGIPAGWTRPTTGWIPGEYVEDEHAIDLPPALPPGEYTLFTGMYDPASAQRLLGEEFPDGRILLGTLTIRP